MDDLREKLIGLLEAAEDAAHEILMRSDTTYRDVMLAEADYLIAGGVTIQWWIPVTERLPKLKPCGESLGYSEAVNVLTRGRKVLTAIWDGEEFIADAEFWEAEGETITHWTPVLLPLPSKEVLL